MLITIMKMKRAKIHLTVFVATVFLQLTVTESAQIATDNSLATIAVDSNDWPSFLGAMRDGKSDESGILRDWSDGKLRVLWTKEIGSGYSMCSVSENRLVQFYGENEQAVVECLDALKELALVAGNDA